jgi:hypothetical protein
MKELPWFRMYAGVINDPKVMRLPEAMRWHWVAVLCCASQNDGKVPSTPDLAFMLRLKDRDVALILAQLHAGGLLDKVEGGFVPHNWEGRQYKSDVSTARVRKHRAKVSGNVSGNVSSDVSETVSETAPEQRQNRTEQIDVADEAPASPGLVGKQAFDLAERLLVIAGHDRSFWPPGWCGAPLRVKTWLEQGWPVEIILAATEAAAKRKQGAPAQSVQFFENAIAEEVARQARPVPVVNIKEGQTINAQETRFAGNRGSLVDAADRNIAAGITFGPKPTGLPARGGRGEGEATVRLLSAR